MICGDLNARTSQLVDLIERIKMYLECLCYGNDEKDFLKKSDMLRKYHSITFQTTTCPIGYLCIDLCRRNNLFGIYGHDRENWNHTDNR